MIEETINADIGNNIVNYENDKEVDADSDAILDEKLY